MCWLALIYAVTFEWATALSWVLLLAAPSLRLIFLFAFFCRASRLSVAGLLFMLFPLFLPGPANCVPSFPPSRPFLLALVASGLFLHCRSPSAFSPLFVPCPLRASCRLALLVLTASNACLASFSVRPFRPCPSLPFSPLRFFCFFMFHGPSLFLVSACSAVVFHAFCSAWRLPCSAPLPASCAAWVAPFLHYGLSFFLVLLSRRALPRPLLLASPSYSRVCCFTGPSHPCHPRSLRLTPSLFVLLCPSFSFACPLFLPAFLCSSLLRRAFSFAPFLSSLFRVFRDLPSPVPFFSLFALPGFFGLPFLFSVSLPFLSPPLPLSRCAPFFPFFLCSPFAPRPPLWFSRPLCSGVRPLRET